MASRAAGSFACASFRDSAAATTASDASVNASDASATCLSMSVLFAIAGVINSESNKGTASNPRVNREEFRRVRKARTLLRSKGKFFKRNGSAQSYGCDSSRVGSFFLQIAGDLAL